MNEEASINSNRQVLLNIRTVFLPKTGMFTLNLIMIKKAKHILHILLTAKRTILILVLSMRMATSWKMV